jgi:C_GCAxxG_C_C family probable redox protein
MTTPQDDAVSHFSEGFNCAQAVLLAHGPRLGIAADDCARLAAPFGAGMARTGSTCGAVTGALMVIGLRLGHTRADDLARKERCYEVNRATNEINVRVVFYGLGLAGKTTLMQRIYDDTPAEQKGKMVSVQTDGDRTVFFDVQRPEFGEVRGSLSSSMSPTRTDRSGPTRPRVSACGSSARAGRSVGWNFSPTHHRRASPSSMS